MLPNEPHQGRVIPFVNEYDVGVVEHLFEIDRRQFVEPTAETRIGGVEGGDGRAALILTQVACAPSVVWLIDGYTMTKIEQFVGNTTKEVRVSVIPVGNERVIEEHEVQRLLR